MEEKLDLSILKEICDESDEETKEQLKKSHESLKKRIKSTSLVIHHKDLENNQERTENGIKWDPEVVDLFKEKFPGVDIYSLSLEELKRLYDDVEALREEFSLIELAYKLLSNGAYGASSSPNFYFYNLELAKDITGECRNLTKYFWKNLEKFFHETIWERKDLWEKFGFELDESKHDLCRQMTVSCYSDTDSVVGETEIHLLMHNVSIVTSFEEFYDYLRNVLKIVPCVDPNGKEVFQIPDYIKVQNWSKEKGLYYTPMKYLMCHPVCKDLYKIETENGKKVVVTGDHSVMAINNNELESVATKELNENDKLITF
jgi:DNA polymerase elongation subunit (family B)